MAKLQLTDRNKGKLDKNGKKRKPNWQWRFEIMIAGKKKSFSKSGFRTKAEAEEAGMKAYNEYTQGTNIKSKEMFYSELLDEWESMRFSQLRYASQKLKRLTIKNHLKPALGNYKVTALDHVILQEFVNNLQKKDLSPSTVHKIASVMKQSLNYAVQVHYLSYNPAQYVIVPKVKSRKIKTLSQEQLEIIFSRFPECDKYHLPLMIGYHTGLRIAEVFGLTWDNIDLVNNNINVEKQMILVNNHGWCFVPLKSETSKRAVKFGNTLAELFKRELDRQEKLKAAYGKYYPKYAVQEETPDNGEKRLLIEKSEKEDVDFVCRTDTGNFMSPKTLDHCSYLIKKELGIDFNFHMLRHTHATILAEAGVNPKAIQTRLGHSNISITLQTYVESTEKMNEEAVSIFEKNISHKSRTK